MIKDELVLKLDSELETLYDYKVAKSIINKKLKELYKCNHIEDAVDIFYVVTKNIERVFKYKINNICEKGTITDEK